MHSPVPEQRWPCWHPGKQETHWNPLQKPKNGSSQQMSPFWPQQVEPGGQHSSLQHWVLGAGQQSPKQQDAPAAQHVSAQQLFEQQSPFAEQGPPTGCNEQTHRPSTVHVSPTPHVPQVPPLPQPSGPHSLPVQLGAQHSPPGLHWLAFP